jgi:hypothetical protein
MPIMKKRASNEASGKNKNNIGISQSRPHPWHGLEVGPEPPEILNAYIEITPFDLVKYEVDKASGYLRVDRPSAILGATSDAIWIQPAHLLSRTGAPSRA